MQRAFKGNGTDVIFQVSAPGTNIRGKRNGRTGKRNGRTSPAQGKNWIVVSSLILKCLTRSKCMRAISDQTRISRRSSGVLRYTKNISGILSVSDFILLAK